MNFSFRARLIILITATVAISVMLVGGLVEANLKRSFELSNQAQTNALVNEFSVGFDRRGAQIAQRVDAVSNSETLLRIALVASQPQPDFSSFVNDAQTIAANQQLDLLEILTHDGTIISSAQWPARFGYKDTWLSEIENVATPSKAFLKRETLADGETLAQVAVAQVKVRSTTIYVVGGLKLDARYFQSLVPPLGLRPMLYSYTQSGFSAANLVEFNASPNNVSAKPQPELTSPAKLAPFIDEIRNAYLNHQTKLSRAIEWSGDPEDAETIHSTALVGRNNELLGALLVAAPVREQIRLARHVRNVTLAVGLSGILFGVLLSFWLAQHVTRPIEGLADAASEVARGNWEIRVAAESTDEIGQLADAFNRMTHELIAQREQLVQTERVAAWRELARRLAHELKNPLFPLQITVENLLRARETSPEQFDEVFRESTTTLLAELSNLKNIIGRFSDFSKMPAPQLQRVDVNALLKEVAQLFQAQFSGAPQLKVEWSLGELPQIDADPVLLRRAMENLVLNALDAMPNGGRITFHTALKSKHDRILIEVGDSGAGLTPEECERLFTPYYTTKQFGTGLGLAIVQAVVSDHGGAISVSSEKSVGTTFHIELPVRAKDAVT